MLDVITHDSDTGLHGSSLFSPYLPSSASYDINNGKGIVVKLDPSTHNFFLQLYEDEAITQTMFRIHVLIYLEFRYRFSRGLVSIDIPLQIPTLTSTYIVM